MCPTIEPLACKHTSVHVCVCVMVGGERGSVGVALVQVWWCVGVFMADPTPLLFQSEEIRQTFKQMSSQPSQRLPSYSYIETNAGVAVNVDPQNEWGEVRMPTAGGRRDGPSAPPSAPPSEQPDYFNVSAISEGQNFVASRPVNRESIIEITRPASKPSPQAAAVVDPRDYANVKQDGDQPQDTPLQEDYVNNPHELLMVQNGGASHDNGQMDYINSAIVDQTLDRRVEQQLRQTMGRTSPDDAYSVLADDRDYINSGELEISEEVEQSGGEHAWVVGGHQGTGLGVRISIGKGCEDWQWEWE